MKSRTICQVLKTLILILVDLLAFYISLFSSYYIRKILGYSILPLYQLTLEDLLKIWWMPIIYLVSNFIFKLYTEEFPFWEEVRRLLKAISAATVAIFSLAFLSKQASEMSRTTIILLWLLSAIVYPIIRLAVKYLIYKIECFKKEIIIIGDADFISSFKQLLKKENTWGYKIKNSINIKNGEQFIEKLSGDKNIILYNIPHDLSIDREKFTAKLQSKAKKILFIPTLKHLSFLHFDAYPIPFKESIILSVKNNLKNPLNILIKRIIDIIISTALLIILFPIFLVLSIIIKFTSKGPIFFSQERIGQNGKPFKILKFRTMYQDSEQKLNAILEKNPLLKDEWEKNRKLKNDPRVTPIGKFLRKTSLDELPQLINVLKGEMSLVGPRPVVKEEIEKYYKEFAIFYYMVKPGITGLWQVSGRNNLSYEERVKLDTWYVNNWSLWLDLIILIRTIKLILTKEGAY